MQSLGCVVFALEVEQNLQHLSTGNMHDGGHGALLVDLDQVKKILIDSTAWKARRITNNDGLVVV